MTRCSWVPSDNQLYSNYHDFEWGKPVYDDQKLFELLCLESYQSGLSWLTVLRKRQAFNNVFFNYDIEKVAQMSESDIAAVLQNPSIIRHRLKLESSVNNAKAVLLIQEEYESFSNILWAYVGKKPIVNTINEKNLVPSQSELSHKLAKDLKKRGFKFLGPTTVYSFLEAAGFINDHEDSCDYK